MIKKFILLIILLGCSLQAAAFAAPPQVTNMPTDHWSYPYLTRAVSSEIDGWWLNYADRDANRQNTIDILSKYLNYLEKNNLIKKAEDPKSVSFKDIPSESVLYAPAKKVIAQYKIMDCVKENEVKIGNKISPAELKTILAKLAVLTGKVQKKEVESIAAKNMLDNFSEKDFTSTNLTIKRYDLISALVKADDYFKKPVQTAKKETKPAPKSTVPETKPEVLSDLKNRINLGGLMGMVNEKSAINNSGYTMGGKVTYERDMGKDKSIEVVGASSAYNMQYLVLTASGASFANKDTKETKIDTQVNFKNQVLTNLAGGNVSSVLGFRGLFLRNGIADSSILGLRGGLEYLTRLGEKLGGRMGLGLTAKVLGDSGTSVLGPITSAFDYGAEVAYDLSPSSFLSLNYEGDALVFGQSTVRYFNTVLLKSGWKL